MSNPVKSNPNATAAAGAGASAILLVWVLSLFGVTVDAEVGAAIATVAAAVLLFVGRKGLKGLVGMIWRGQG